METLLHMSQAAPKIEATITVADVLKEPINTDALVASQFINAKEAGLLQDFITEPAEERGKFLDELGVEVIDIFVKLLQQIVSENEVRYLITFLDELISADKSRAALFTQVVRLDSDPYDSFLRILDRYPENTFIVTKTSHLLAALITGVPEIKGDAIARFIDWAVQNVNNPNPKSLVAVVTSLKDLLKVEALHPHFLPVDAAAAGSEDRDVVLATKAGRNVSALSQLLVSQSQNTQVLYEVGFCMWLLSYNPTSFVYLSESRVVKHLVAVIKSMQRVKVVRIALATLRNLSGQAKFNEEMIESGLSRLFSTLNARLAQWDDEEMTDDVKALESVINKDMKDLSSFEMYEKEVTGGELQWSIVHTEKFWRENHLKFEKDNFKIIRQLIALLSKEDSVTLAVACYDLGEFARFHPNGKKVIQKLDGKSKLMLKMAHKSVDVSKQALLAVQKVMVNSWEFLSAGSQQQA